MREVDGRLEKAAGVKPKTWEQYEYAVRLHLKPAFGEKPLASLQAQDVRDFISEKLKAGLSPRTVHTIRAILRAALNVALKDGLIPRNAAIEADPPRIPRRGQKLHVYTPAEARRFLAAAESDRLGACFVLMFDTGLREGEALGLKWPAVDFMSRTLRVEANLQLVKLPGEEKGTLRLITPKSDDSAAVVRLPLVAVAALAAHKRRQEAERDLCGSAWKDTDFVFVSRIGTPLDAKKLFLAYREICKTAKVPVYRIHDIRHTAAALLIRQGKHPKVIQEALRHSDFSTTMNVYGHLYDDIAVEAADALDSILSGRENAGPETDGCQNGCQEAEFSDGQKTEVAENEWSWRRESNPRPTDYKSVALPTELRQPARHGAGDGNRTRNQQLGRL